MGRWLRRFWSVAAVACVITSVLEAAVPGEHHDSVTSIAANVHPPTHGTDADGRSGESAHPVHLDHCTHTHVFAQTAPARLPTRMALAERNSVLLRPLFESTTTAPQARPPIS